MTHREDTKEIKRPCRMSDKSNVPQYLKDVVLKAKAEGRRLILVEVTGLRPMLATTESIKDLPAIFGDALVCAVNSLYQQSKGEFTKRQILESVLSAACVRAEDALGIVHTDA